MVARCRGEVTADWSCDYLKQRTCNHIHTRRNVLYWLFGCARRCVVGDKAIADLKATLSLSHSLTCDTYRVHTHTDKAPASPFCIGSMAGTFVRAPSIHASVWWAALCRLISECFHMNVAAQPWMSLCCFCMHVFRLMH